MSRGLGDVYKRQVLYKNMPVTVTTIYKDDCLVKDDKGNLYTALFEQLMPIK